MMHLQQIKARRICQLISQQLIRFRQGLLQMKLSRLQRWCAYGSSCSNCRSREPRLCSSRQGSEFSGCSSENRRWKLCCEFCLLILN